MFYGYPLFHFWATNSSPDLTSYRWWLLLWLLDRQTTAATPAASTPATASVMPVPAYGGEEAEIAPASVPTKARKAA